MLAKKMVSMIYNADTQSQHRQQSRAPLREKQLQNIIKRLQDSKKDKYLDQKDKVLILLLFTKSRPSGSCIPMLAMLFKC